MRKMPKKPAAPPPAPEPAEKPKNLQNINIPDITLPVSLAEKQTLISKEATTLSTGPLPSARNNRWKLTLSISMG